jgi:MraZ protein
MDDFNQIRLRTFFSTVSMWENVGKMTKSFFSGSYSAKLDEKNRLVLPQELRYQLVEDGKLEFTIALSMGGCLAIYRKSDITEIVERFKKKQHIAKFQKFFTLFFSTLVETTCDKVGRIMIPSVLKNGVGMKSEVIIAGALNKIELWPKEVYERDLAKFIGGEAEGDLQQMMEDAFSLLSDDEEENVIEQAVERVQKEAVRL